MQSDAVLKKTLFRCCISPSLYSRRCRWILVPNAPGAGAGSHSSHRQCLPWGQLQPRTQAGTNGPPRAAGTSGLPSDPRAAFPADSGLKVLPQEEAAELPGALLLLAFFISNLAKDPPGPTPRYCWKAEHHRVQLCEEASGCECSAPNQHVGVTTLHVL